MAEPWPKRVAWIVQNYDRGDESRFVRNVKISRETARLWKGKGRPRLDNLVLILTSYPKLSPEWLVTGEGPRERSDTESGRAVARDVLAELRRFSDELAERYPDATAPAGGAPATRAEAEVVASAGKLLRSKKARADNDAPQKAPPARPKRVRSGKKPDTP